MSEQNNTEMTFQIQRIYTKDISFEAPNAPHVFQKDWQPEVKLDLDTAFRCCFLHMSEQNNTEMTFQIQRIYTKDISFEAPNAPHVFQKDWQPEVKLDLDTASTQLADDVYEVVLRVTVTASLGEETAFLCEVQQGGIFSIAGIEGTQMAHCLGAYCPNILFPYARECITSMVSRGTFPQLNLAPVNFDALFMNYLQQQAGEGTEEHQDA